MKERISSVEDFTNKSRYGVPFEGPHPDEMSEAKLTHLNVRWEQFFREKKGLMDALAGYDEDLSSIGMLSVRRTLALYPDCPESWLVQRAKYDMKCAKRWGGNLDSDKRSACRDDIHTHRGDEPDRFAQRLANFLCSQQEYRILEERGDIHRFEREQIDTIAFKQYLATLNKMEQRLVQILKEEDRDPPRWYQGKYVKVPDRRIGVKKRFKQEVSPSETDYLVSFANTRLKFYEMFGTDEEIQRERTWYQSWKPSQSLHVSRTGKYQRTGVYSPKK
jgi:hypothetical protein